MAAYAAQKTVIIIANKWIECNRRDDNDAHAPIHAHGTFEIIWCNFAYFVNEKMINS